MEQSDKTKEIIRLRADGKRYEDIVDILGCTKKSVAYVCQKYKCTYHDIEDKWIESLSKLRHDGYDYIEISKISMSLVDLILLNDGTSSPFLLSLMNFDSTSETWLLLS